MEKHSTNLLHTLLPIYKISKCLGLAPFSIYKKDGIYIVENTISSTLFSTFILIWACVCNLIFKHKSMNLTIIGRNEFTLIVIVIQRYYLIAVGSISVFQHILNRKNITSLLKTMIWVDEQILRNNIDILYKKQKKELKIKSIIPITIVFSIIFIVELIYWLKKSQDKENIIFRVLRSFSDIVVMINFTFMVQFWVLMSLIQNRYQLINEKMKNLQKIKVINMLKEYNISYKSNNIMKIVRNICKIHRRITKAASMLNRLFSTHMILMLLGVFISNVGRLYMAAIRIDSEMKYDKSLSFLGKTILWISIYNISVYAVLKKADDLSKEVSCNFSSI